MKNQNQQLFHLAILLSVLMILVSCTNRSEVSYNHVTGYDFSQMFGTSQTKVLSKIEKWKEISNVSLFQEFVDEQKNEIRVYSLDENTGTFSFIVYLSFEERNGKWVLNSCEKKGVGKALSEAEIMTLSQKYDTLCGRYGEPEFTEFDDKVFSDLLTSDQPVNRTANWPGSIGRPVAVFGIQISSKESNLYIMERKKS